MYSLRQMQESAAEMRECRSVGKFLQSYLDGELDDAKVARVSTHLEHCLRCGMKVETYENIKRALVHIGEHGEVHPEDQLALERLRRFASSLGSSG